MRFLPPRLPSVLGLFLMALISHDLGAEPDSFSPAVRAGGFVFASGVRATDDRGAFLAGDIKEQTRRALENLGTRLDAAGSSLAMAASVNVYLKNAADFAAMNEVYRGFWPKDPPVRTTIVSSPAGGALVEIAATAIPLGGERKLVHPSSWVASPNPYSYGILSGDTLFLAGLVSRNGKDNTVVPGDIQAQTKTVLENGGEILRAAGMTHQNVVQARLYITDAALFQDMNATYRGFFPKDPPARATVVAALMGPQYLIEITLVAVRGAREAITPKNADGSPGTPNPNLSHAIRVGDRLWLSGVLGNTDATKGDGAAQTRETFARIGRALQTAGFSWEHVREGVVYVSDVAQLAAVENVWRERFPKGPPAGVVVETPLVAADGLVEIMLAAAKASPAGSR